VKLYDDVLLFLVVYRTQNFHNFIKVALTKQPKRRPTSDKLLEVSHEQAKLYLGINFSVLPALLLFVGF